MLAYKKIVYRRQSNESNNLDSYTICENDWVANESILSIHVNSEELTNFSCSPAHLEEMAVGFLFTSGVISEIDEIAKMQLCPDNSKVSIVLKENIPFDNRKWQRQQTITSGCGQGKSFYTQAPNNNLNKITSPLTISAEYISELFSDLRNISVGYKNTGCIHLAALIKKEGPSIMREDIGRHNAIDKVIGAGLRLKFDFSQYILCCSGRISSDMLLKAGRAGIPIVASRAAPTSLAVDFATEIGITLIGFIRGNRFNIYSHPERVLQIKNSINQNTQECIEESMLVFNNGL